MQPASQAHETAAHRADHSVDGASAAFPGRRAGSLGRAWDGREQGIDLGFGSLFAKERENRLDRFFRNFWLNISGGGNAGDQFFHLKPRWCASIAHLLPCRRQNQGVRRRFRICWCAGLTLSHDGHVMPRLEGNDLPTLEMS